VKPVGFWEEHHRVLHEREEREQRVRESWEEEREMKCKNEGKLGLHPIYTSPSEPVRFSWAEPTHDPLP